MKKKEYGRKRPLSDLRLYSNFYLNCYGPKVNLCATRFNIQEFYLLPTKHIYVFWKDLRTNTDYVPTQQVVVALIILIWNVSCACTSGNSK